MGSSHDIPFIWLYLQLFKTQP